MRVPIEFAKLCAFHALRTLRDLAPYVPWSLRALITRLICLGALLLTRLQYDKISY